MNEEIEAEIAKYGVPLAVVEKIARRCYLIAESIGDASSDDYEAGGAYLVADEILKDFGLSK